MTISEIRKKMRALALGEILLVEGWGQIQKGGHGYSIGPLPEDDDSDPYSDYSAWSFCWKEKWVLDRIARDLGIV